MAHTLLPDRAFSIERATDVQIYPNLLSIRVGGLPKERLFRGTWSYGVAYSSVQSFLPGRIRSRARKKAKTTEKKAGEALNRSAARFFGGTHHNEKRMESSQEGEREVT